MTSAQPDAPKPRLVGINHVSLEVGGIEEALHFYHQIFSFRAQRNAQERQRRMRDGFRRHGRPVPRIDQGAAPGP